MPLVSIFLLGLAAQFFARQAAEELRVLVRQKTGFAVQFSGASFSVFPTLSLVLSDLSVAPAALRSGGSNTQRGAAPAAAKGSAEENQVELPFDSPIFTLSLQRLSLGLDVPSLWNKELRVGQVVLQGLAVELPSVRDTESSEPGASGTATDQSGSHSAQLAEKERPIAAVAGLLRAVWERIPVLLDVQGVTLDGAHLIRPSFVRGSVGFEAEMRGKLHARVAAHPLQKEGRLHIEVEEGTHLAVSLFKRDTDAAVSVREQTVHANLSGSMAVVVRSSGSRSSMFLETFQVQGSHFSAVQRGEGDGDRRLNVGELGLVVGGTPEHAGHFPAVCGFIFETFHSDELLMSDGPQKSHRDPTLTVQPCLLRLDLEALDWSGASSAVSSGQPPGVALQNEPLALSVEMAIRESIALQDRDLRSPGGVHFPELSLFLVLRRALRDAAGIVVNPGQPFLPGGDLPSFGSGASVASVPALATFYAAIKEAARTSNQEQKGERSQNVRDVVLSLAAFLRPIDMLNELRQRAQSLLPRAARKGVEELQDLSTLRGAVLRSEWNVQMGLSELLAVAAGDFGAAATAEHLKKAAPRIQGRLRADWLAANQSNRSGTSNMRSQATWNPDMEKMAYVDLMASIQMVQSRLQAELKTKAYLNDSVLVGLPVSELGLSAELSANLRNGKAKPELLVTVPWQSFGFEGFGGGRASFSAHLQKLQHRSEALISPKMEAAPWLPFVKQVEEGRLRGHVTISPSVDIDVPQLEGTIHRRDQKDPMVALVLRARLPASRDQATLTGRLTLSAEQAMVLPVVSPQNHQPVFQGSLAFPLNFTMQHEKPGLSGEGDAGRSPWLVHLESVAVADVRQLLLPKMGLYGLRGQLPVDQNVRLIPAAEMGLLNADDFSARLEWAPLLSANPFRRADSQEVSGLYSAARNLVLQKLELRPHAGELTTLGPLSATLAVKQNQFIIDAVDADVYSGQVSGFSLVNLHPDELSVSFSGRLSQLDGSQMFGFEDLRQSDAGLSGRAALFYTFADSHIEGRVDLAAVPRPLLERLIARSDPRGADSKMGIVRKALSVARPGQVGVEFHDGVADLNLELLLARGGSQNLRVPDMPVTSFLEGRVAPLRQKIEGTMAPTRGRSVLNGLRAVDQTEDEERVP